MFTTAIYPDRPRFAQLHWTGSNAQTGSPCALEMAGGQVYIESGPFIDKQGEETLLVPEEKLVLAFLAAGVGGTNIYPEAWYDEPEGSAFSLRRKLGAGVAWPGESTVAFAFENDLLVPDPDRPMNLEPIRDDNRLRFLQVMRLIGSGRSHRKILEALDMDATDIKEVTAASAQDMGWHRVPHPTQAFVTLVGSNGGLPTYAGVSEPRKLLATPPEREKLLTRLFPSPLTRSLEWPPIEGYPNTLIRFTGQPMEVEGPLMHVGGIDQIRLAGAVIEVAKTTMRQRVLAAFALRCVGMTPAEVAASTAIREGAVGDFDLLLEAYDTLLPKVPGRPRTHATERSMRAAFDQRLFVTFERPDFRRLDGDLRSDVMLVADGLAQGKTASSLRPALSKGTVRERLDEAQDRLELPNRIAVLLAAEAERAAIAAIADSAQK